METGRDHGTQQRTREELIAALYAAILAPAEYDQMIGLLDGLQFEEGDFLAAVAVQLAAIENHIASVRSVQVRIGSGRLARWPDSALVSFPGPAIAFSRGEQVLASNPAARARFGSAFDKLPDIIGDPSVLKQIRAFIGSAPGDDGDVMALSGYAGVKNADGRAESLSFVIRRLKTDTAADANDPVFLLAIIELAFSDQTVRLFRAAYDLTRAEADVAVMLASGLRVTDIAKKRAVSADTIRTQIKAIKSKTGVADIAGLVRLLCSYSAGLAAPHNAGDDGTSADTAGTAHPLKRWRQVVLPDRRRLDYLEQGAGEGHPVLLFHNIPYGVEIPLEAVKRAAADNLRVIAPLRGGYGRSSFMSDLAPDAALSACADDYKAVLDALGIGKVVVLAHSGGASFALRFATRHPAAVQAIILVGRSPVWRDEWIKDMPRQQRLVVRLTKHLPQALPVVAWSIVACLDSPHAARFVINAVKESEADSRSVADREIINLIAGGTVSAMSGTLDGFCRDCAVSLLDLTQDARDSPHKAHILHGEDDRIVPVHQSRHFVDSVPGSTLEVIPDAGQLLFFSHWPAVLRAVCGTLAREAGKPGTRQMNALP